MHKTFIAAAALAAALAGAATAAAQELRIGYLATLTGGTAIIGKQMVNGWNLGLNHEGWNKDGDKIAGVPLRMFYGDDQFKPDAALKEVEKFIKQDKVQIVAGFQWSHVMLAASKPLIQNKIIMMSNVAGATPFAAKGCSPYWITTGWNNDQTAEVGGILLNEDKVKTVYTMAPNYQAGKDVLNGFRTAYKGKVIGQTLFKPGETDFQANISRIRADKPEAVFLFAPGPMGISFVKQWAASGAGKTIKLYTLFVVDWITLGALGEAAIGTYHTNQWDPDSKNPVNQKFIKDYLAKHNAMPSHFAQQAYDGPRLLAAALKKTGGKFSDPRAFMTALRHTPFPSIRGTITYNVNGVPIQDFFKREVVKQPDGKLWIKTTAKVVANSKDSYWQQCPQANRL